MSRRRMVIGAIGGDRQLEWASKFGRAVAEAGCILLTGGGDNKDDEVKNATFFGMTESTLPGVVPRAIGILPSAPDTSPHWHLTTPSHLLLETGLTHNVRNLINGVTPDVVVVFGGSRGTLAEMAFAAAVGKPLFFFGVSDPRTPRVDSIRLGAVERLQHNHEKYFDGTGKQKDIDIYLEAPLRTFSGVIPRTAAQLITLIEHTLASASDWQGSAEALVQRCIQSVDPHLLDRSTGFPDLPGQSGSKQRFEDLVHTISRV